MTERDLTQSTEELETKSERQATQELDEATHEPGARVEQIGNVGQAEAIETAVVDLVGSDRKISQTDPPKTAEEELKPTKKDKEGGDAATPINLPSPESKTGTIDEKTEPDPKGSEVKVADDSKSESAQRGEGKSEKPESLEATPITLPGKEYPAASSPPGSGELEGKDKATMEPQRLDKELPESKVQGKQRPDKDLGNGLDPSGDIGGLMGDPFGVDSGLDSSGPGDGLHGDSGGIGAGDVPGGFDLNFGTPKDLDAGLENDMPKETPGGPGMINPTKGPMGQGMVMEGGDEEKEGGKMVTSFGDEAAVVVTAERPGSSEDNPVDAGHVTIDVTKELALQEMQQINVALNFVVQQIANDIELGGDGSGVKTGQQTPRPDGDDGSVEPPKSEDDLDKGGFDPGHISRPAEGAVAGKPGGAIDTSKSGGQVTDPAESQDSGKLKDSGLKAGAEQITDPPEEGAGKETSSRKG